MRRESPTKANPFNTAKIDNLMNTTYQIAQSSSHISPRVYIPEASGARNRSNELDQQEGNSTCSPADADR